MLPLAFICLYFFLDLIHRTWQGKAVLLIFVIQNLKNVHVKQP
jgi:hypothetical protein